MVEFISDIIWFGLFFVEGHDYWSNFLACYRSVEIFCFTLSSRNLCFYRDSSISGNLSNLLAYDYSKCYLRFLFNSKMSVLMPEISSLIRYICVPLLFFFLNLEKSLSILLIFSKKQLLVSLYISIPCFIYLCLMFIISSLMLALGLGFVCFSFSISLKYAIRLLIWRLHPLM